MAWVTKTSTEQYDQNPEPPREYTDREKADNWWHYHWKIVVAAVVLAVVAIWFIHDTVFQTRPDVTIAYVGEGELPADTVTALESALTPYCTDRNGDGKVVVEVSQYAVSFVGYENEATSESAALATSSTGNDAYYQMAGLTRLSADISEGDPYIYLLADPAGFEQNLGALQYLDGTTPEDSDTLPDDAWRTMVYRWTDCPVLAGMELGDYNGYSTLDTLTGPNQDVLGTLYVGRLGDWKKSADERADDVALWDALTEGATPMED